MMLNSLEALAGKISPGSGKNSPQQAGLDTNGFKACKSCIHNNVHPYMKPQHHQQHAAQPANDNLPKEK